MNGNILNEDISKILKLNKLHKEAFLKLSIKTPLDLLYHFPNRYSDASEIKPIKDIEEGEDVTLYGSLDNLKLEKTYQGGVPVARAVLNDGTGKVKLIWFNQPYIAKMYTEGNLIKVSGKITKLKETLILNNPAISKSKTLPIDIGDSLFKTEESTAIDEFLQPIYRETKNVTSNFLYYSIKKTISLSSFKNIVDPIPSDILKKYNLPKLSDALLYIHFPKTKEHAQAARKRFAFEEIFYIQIEKKKERKTLESVGGFDIQVNQKELDSFLKRFDFKLTGAQEKVIENIRKDFESGTPSARLIEGDVGSGKTAVAAVATHLIVNTRPKKYTGEESTFGNLQVAYMAPTEILAKQHFQNFIEFFRNTEIKIGLITSSGCFKFPSKTNKESFTKISKAQLSKWVENGEIAIVIGTHSLIQKNVKFKHLGLCIIDEQHRFGVKQRKALADKRGSHNTSLVPHFLSMTATPIPRTLALTIYGDLDLSLLDEMPPGRKNPITTIVNPHERDTMYSDIKKELEKGRQLYVICPRISDPDEKKENALILKSVKTEAERLKKLVFKNYNIDILHSKMKPDEKEAVMNNFKDKKIDILVATSVVEVGVNVQNANMIIIEGAERFGLSQLHQLRGRVIRGTHQPYCYIAIDKAVDKSMQRLKSLCDVKNGFELAEIDLELRGSGGLNEGKQWGISDIAMEAIKNVKLVEAAKDSAINIIEEDFSLNKFPILKAKMEERENTHLE